MGKDIVHENFLRLSASDVLGGCRRCDLESRRHPYRRAIQRTTRTGQAHEHAYPKLMSKVEGVEPLDHPTDGEPLTYALRYLKSADRKLGSDPSAISEASIVSLIKSRRPHCFY